MRSFIFCGETEIESFLRSECWIERIAARQNCRASCGDPIRFELFWIDIDEALALGEERFFTGFHAPLAEVARRIDANAGARA